MELCSLEDKVKSMELCSLEDEVNSMELCSLEDEVNSMELCSLYVRSEISTAVFMSVQVFWDVVLCCAVRLRFPAVLKERRALIFEG
jgi:hypothetical protein